VTVPTEPIAKLGNMKLSGEAFAKGLDTLVYSVGTKAYRTSGQASVVYLGSGWMESEFNIFGDGGGAEASFNSGTFMHVKIGVGSSTTNAPACASNAGTTGEGNDVLGLLRRHGWTTTLYRVQSIELKGPPHGIGLEYHVPRKSSTRSIVQWL